MRLGTTRAALLMAMVSLAPAARAEPPDPAVLQIERLCDVWIDTMKHATELGVRGRYEKLKPTTDQLFDYPDMVRFIVGSENWAKTPGPDQQKLIAAFARYTAAVWADRLDGYGGEKFTIEPKTTVRGQDRVVMTKLVGKDETNAIAFRMRLVEGSWKIVDVYYKNTMSQLATEHDGDSPTVQAGGVPALERAMQAKAEKLLK